MSRSVEKLIKAFSRLPGIGEKTAGRLTYHLLKTPADQAERLAEAILDSPEYVDIACFWFIGVKTYFAGTFHF